MGSKAPAVVDALLALFTAAAPADVLVWDGPVPSDATSDALFVGYNADPDGNGESITSERSRVNFTGQSYNEDITVSCGAYHRNGAGNVKAARDRAYELLALAEDALNGSQRLGLADVQDAQIRSSQLFLQATSAGVDAWMVIDVAVRVLGGN